jgi:IclR family transcriptional regulator, KDG regulon repressor
MGPKRSYHVQVLDRAFAILDALAEKKGSLARVAELSKHLKLDKSTVYRLLKVLERNEYVERDPSDGNFRLGAKILHLAALAMADVDVTQASQPYLEKLVSLTGETAHLGVLRNSQIISVAVALGSMNLRMGVSVGGNSPIHCTALGKAILAFVPRDECLSIIEGIRFASLTSRTITKKSALVKELQSVRERGYSIDNEEFEPGLKCIGAPVRNNSGKVIGAISVAGPAFRMTEPNMARLSGNLIQTANELSEELGFRSL